MVQQAAFTEFRALCSELGLTPYSMNKLGVNLTVKKDETAAFLFGDD
jgi:phage terminase small subunit